MTVMNGRDFIFALNIVIGNLKVFKNQLSTPTSIRNDDALVPMTGIIKISYYLHALNDDDHDRLYHY